MIWISRAIYYLALRSQCTMLGAAPPAADSLASDNWPEFGTLEHLSKTEQTKIKGNIK